MSFSSSATAGLARTLTNYAFGIRKRKRLVPSLLIRIIGCLVEMP